MDPDTTSGNRTPSPVAEYFGRLAATYGEGEYYGKRRRAVVETLAVEIANAREVLDVGCGNGAYLAEFVAAPGNRRVTGADLSIAMLKSARKRVGAECLLLCADVSRPPFKGQSFDFIFASHVLQFAADLDGVVAEIARCVRPGGMFVATGRRENGIRQMLSATVGPGRWHEYRQVIFQRVRREADEGPDDRYQRAFARAGLRVEERAASFTVGWAAIEEFVKLRCMPVIPESDRAQADAMLKEVAKAAPSGSFTLQEPLILGRRDKPGAV